MQRIRNIVQAVSVCTLWWSGWETAFVDAMCGGLHTVGPEIVPLLEHVVYLSIQ